MRAGEDVEEKTPCVLLKGVQISTVIIKKQYASFSNS